MIDLDRIEGFDWDEGNSRKSADKHAASPAEAEQIFFTAPPLISEDVKHSASEPRYHALGVTEAGRPLHVTLTVRFGTKIRVISARDMNARERRAYAQKIETDSELP